MDDKIVNKAFEYVDAVAQKLGVAADYVYQLLVKQQIISAVPGLVIGLIFMIASYFLLKKSIPLLIDDDLDFFGFMSSVLGITVCAVTGVIIFFDNIGPLINPEYYAIKEIMSFVSGK
ncbi:hypothetical protein [Aneurinibacillus aneurinilyticus]|uniref:Uncharacterized protein n=1 Tax=Aneurinibacillus aneurinilyticus TaxID=1391 RepID=A0A848CZW1_ANEAE|nr:hypothetical protein [Aneurinibacillus aneurinilyticus]NMF00040.1 hypothetical protein [Aneurinibacillus aneurinilyticus]